MKLLKPLITSTLTIFLLAYFLPTVSYMNWTTLALAAVVLTLLNKIARPVLKILFLPINVVTLGLFSVVLNVALLWLVTYLVPGFHIEAMTLLGVQFNEFFSLLIVSTLIGVFQNFLGFLL
ncbi:MAG: phage holin family protein [Candidatus Pacebacteria bacterium]|jgi:putative membrane protein|nr:phage holin family protein [Candidatus Paceibacterota bacterium]MBT3511768.1 phage holin family protein [Candidatus Paceibacterota bacterium]MBT4005193.1 phage holin family protein [Candidatus Paceibacterota bacterium]MBT4359019.1 phage holin family protein [Candidatus Paceibacterota bacterium]MBT4681294.1 phage holin family protein [Candidatus Paceibacterota bacterium]